MQDELEADFRVFFGKRNSIMKKAFDKVSGNEGKIDATKLLTFIHSLSTNINDEW